MIEGYGGLRGPNLTRVAEHLTTPEMEWHILNGGRNMPAFATILKPEEVNDLPNFLHTQDLAEGTRVSKIQR